MQSKILLIAFSFFSFTLSSQTVIKTKTNKGDNKKVTIKKNTNNSKGIIIKNQTGYSDNNVIVNGNKVVVKKPNRPKRIKKRYNKKRRGYVWVKGYWKWSPIFKTYFWQDGYWIKKRRNHFWVNGYWIETNGGYFWVDGFWDKNF